jgi:hypothetical protein
MLLGMIKEVVKKIIMKERLFDALIMHWENTLS